MYIFLILAIFAMAYGTDFFGPMRVVLPQERIDTRVDAIAYNMAVYHGAAYKFMMANPTRVGTINDDALRRDYLPSTYPEVGAVSWPIWRAEIFPTGAVAVTPVPTAAMPTGLPHGIQPQMVARRAAELKGNSFGVGFVSNQTLRSAQDNPLYTQPLPLPAGASYPEGSLVMITWGR